MKWSLKDIKTGADLCLVTGESGFCRLYDSRSNLPKYFTIAWNRGDRQTVTIEGTDYDFPPNTLLTLLFNQSFSFADATQVTAWQFNREFYCIIDHDTEVSCVGFLFGTTEHLFVNLDTEALQKIALLAEMFMHELQTKDKVQHELLLALLKRLIIFITRLARNEYVPAEALRDDRFDTIRKFNLLVEGEYCREHSVSYYAARLNKSPKTLANLFALYNQKTPGQVIQERILIEAKRLLHHTDQPIKQITFQLGFEEPPHFSNFFKKHTSLSPVDFRNQQKIAEKGN